MDITRISWKYLQFVEISTFRGYYPHFINISVFHGYYPHFVEISTFCGYYTHFVDIICIGKITSYLACDVIHVLHRLVLVVGIIYIGHITSY